MKIFILSTILFTFSFSQLFINEIDYDQPGTDSAEYLEIAGPAGTYQNVVVSLINGSSNSEYNSFELGTITLADETDGYGFFVIGGSGIPEVDFSDGFPGSNAIQNGGSSPDGIELWVNGAIADAVSYEGEMTDSEGNPMEAVDPSFYEGLAGLSIGRDGVPGFPWSVDNITPGAINENQVLDANANMNPVADAGEDFSAGSGETVILDGSASYDPDGIIVYYIWEQMEGTAVEILDAETAQASFIVPDGSGTLVFQLTVYDDGAASDTDDVTVTVCSAGVTSIEDARALGIGACVTVQGIVISPSFQSGSGEFAVQDQSAGIILFAPDLTLDLNVGDEVIISGNTDEYNGKFEIVIEGESQLSNLGAGELPAVQIITVSDLSGNGEEYESELIRIENVLLSSGSWPAEGSSANLDITDDGVSTVTMRIDSDTEIDGSEEPSWPVNVTGVGGQYDFTDPYTSGYQILPRFVSDFEATGGNLIPIADAGDDQIVSPGDLVTLDATGSFDEDGLVIGYIWEQTAGDDVPLSDYEEAIVTFTAPTSEGVLQFSLTAIDDQGAFGFDDVTVIVSGGGVTVYDIQYTEDPGSGDDCYPSPLYSPDQYVVVSGVVTAVQPGSHPNFFIQDPDLGYWGGVYVYDDTIDPEVGEEIVLAAIVDEYYGYTELKNTAGHAVISSGNNIEPLVVTTAELAGGCSLSGESLEGVLVRVNDVTVTSLADFGQFYVSDGSGGDAQIDDFLFDGSMPEISGGMTLDYITGVVDYSFGEYGINPRNQDDLGIEIQSLSVYDIQYTENPGDGTYPSEYDGQGVTLTGIVTASGAYSSGNSNRFYLSDPEGGAWHGIFVFNSFDGIMTGDEVEVTGTVTEFYGMTQIADVTTVNILSSDNPVPDPVITGTLAANSEMYEGVLVQVENAVVTSEPDEHGQWLVDDGSGAVQIDDSMYEYSTPTLGMTFDSITGAVDYSFDEFGIHPRWENDLVPAVTGCDPDGDVTEDGQLDVLDIVAVVAHVLGSALLPEDIICHADINGDGEVDVLDIVNLVDMILNPAVRAADAQSARLFIGNDTVLLTGDGFIGGVQMSVTHDDDFSFEFEPGTYLADSYSSGNMTKIVIIHPGKVLFSYGGHFEVVEVTAASRSSYPDMEIIHRFTLLANYPNPFNPVTTVQFGIEQSGYVDLSVYDLSGKLAERLVSGQLEAGYHEVRWDASDFASGFYLLRLNTSGVSEVQKISLIK